MVILSKKISVVLVVCFLFPLFSCGLIREDTEDISTSSASGQSVLSIEEVFRKVGLSSQELRHFVPYNSRDFYVHPIEQCLKFRETTEESQILCGEALKRSKEYKPRNLDFSALKESVNILEKNWHILDRGRLKLLAQLNEKLMDLGWEQLIARAKSPEKFPKSGMTEGICNFEQFSSAIDDYVETYCPEAYKHFFPKTGEFIKTKLLLFLYDLDDLDKKRDQYEQELGSLMEQGINIPGTSEEHVQKEAKTLHDSFLNDLKLLLERFYARGRMRDKVLYSLGLEYFYGTPVERLYAGTRQAFSREDFERLKTAYDRGDSLNIQDALHLALIYEQGGIPYYRDEKWCDSNLEKAQELYKFALSTYYNIDDESLPERIITIDVPVYEKDTSWAPPEAKYSKYNIKYRKTEEQVVRSALFNAPIGLINSLLVNFAHLLEGQPDKELFRLNLLRKAESQRDLLAHLILA